MPTRIRDSNRFHSVEAIRTFSPDRARRDLRGRQGQADRFTLVDTTLPSAHQTLFQAYATRTELVVAACLLDLRGPGAGPGALADELELFFDPFHDHLGYFQFVFSPDGNVLPVHHLPYPEARSTRFAMLRPLRHLWELNGASKPALTEAERAVSGAQPEAWFFAWFALADVFRHGDVCGFNVARQHRGPPESASWNPASGVGFQDASGFGHLRRHRRFPRLSVESVRADGRNLLLAGRLSGAGRGAGLALTDPEGRPVPLRVARRGGRWTARAGRRPALGGRYRLALRGPARVRTEPDYVSVDLSGPRARRAFEIGMTYDIPDDVGASPVPYTPASLEAELTAFAGAGVRHIAWIDYPPDSMVWRLARNPGLVRDSFHNCGDLFQLAARLSKRLGLSFLGTYKPFDLAIDFSHWDTGRVGDSRHTVRNLEGRSIPVPREMHERQDSVMQLNPAWRRPAAFPVRRLRFYSETPIPTLRPADLRVWVSADDRRFTPFRGSFRLRQGVLMRPHQRWTPAGPRADTGAAPNGFLELSGLDLRTPFAAVEILKPGVSLRHRAHAFAEAWGGDGQPADVTLATSGSRDHGFLFWQEWVSWCNRSPRLVEDFTWKTGCLGLTFDRLDRLPTLLEPACGASRAIWLNGVRRILDSPADGVNIRTLCHHNNVMDYWLYAFAPAVREAFRGRYGREPDASAADAERLRRLRGDAYTDLFREARRLASARGKKLVAHLECGIEVPPAFDQRMQINLDWETWLTEGLLDEIELKWWFPQNPFIHERVLPLARRLGVPVRICDRNCSLTNTARAIERAEGLVRDAYQAGFSGYNWYEACSYKYRNADHRVVFLRETREAIRRSAQVAAELAGG